MSGIFHNRIRISSNNKDKNNPQDNEKEILYDNIEEFQEFCFRIFIRAFR